MWELDCEEGWAPKNWWFWTVVLEKTLESPLDCKDIQPVHSEVDQPRDFFGRNDAKAETPVLWPPHWKSWLIRKDSDAGRDWGQEEKGTTEDEMAGWHHWLDRRESEWAPGVGDGLGGLVCCSSWGLKESATTEWLNWTEVNWGPCSGGVMLNPSPPSFWPLLEASPSKPYPSPPFPVSGAQVHAEAQDTHTLPSPWETFVRAGPLPTFPPLRTQIDSKSNFVALYAMVLGGEKKNTSQMNTDKFTASRRQDPN